MLSIGIGLTSVPVLARRSPTYDPDALAFFARLTNQPTDARKKPYSDLVASLKSSGAWAVRDWYHVIGPDAQSTCLNLHGSSYTMVPVNSPVFLADRYYQGDGSSAHLNIGAVRNALANYKQDSANIAAWSGPAAAADTSSIGVNAAGAPSRVVPYGAAGGVAVRVNDATTVSAASTNSVGWISGNRSSSTDKQLFRDGTQVALTLSSPSTALAADTFCYLRDGPTYRNAPWLAGAGGGSLTLAQHAAEATAIRNYLIAIGAYTP